MTSTVIWRSPAIRLVADDAASAARFDTKVLITGESGVGKEVVARFIHEQSVRRAAPFIVINCGGVPDTLLESELFGHERGSFTGAYRDKPGMLERAHSGTVFLDEVGEMSARMQGLLLRFLETGELQRVGSGAANRRVDVRVIAATNRRLFDRVTEGAFREDLYYRLNVIQIDVPPLRERVEDILPLMDAFLSSFAARSGAVAPALEPDATRMLEEYQWPGNVRELRNLAERLLVRGRSTVTVADLLLDSVRPSTPVKMPLHAPRIADLVFERMVRGGESFWAAAYPAFMDRDMTREDLRAVISRGLQHTNGDYRMLIQLFNMKSSDYKRFLYFLRKHHCHMAVQAYRGPTTSGEAASVAS